MTVRLTAEDLADLQGLRNSVEGRDALNALIPASHVVTSRSSEAELLHALVVAGLSAVREAVGDQSYVAEANPAGVSDKERRSVANRRGPCLTDVR